MPAASGRGGVAADVVEGPDRDEVERDHDQRGRRGRAPNIQSGSRSPITREVTIAPTITAPSTIQAASASERLRVDASAPEPDEPARGRRRPAGRPGSRRRARGTRCRGWRAAREARPRRRARLPTARRALPTTTPRVFSSGAEKVIAHLASTSPRGTSSTTVVPEPGAENRRALPPTSRRRATTDSLKPSLASSMSPRSKPTPASVTIARTVVRRR